eukprot:366569-Chlamydomonas_euryale.AAC.15
MLRMLRLRPAASVGLLHWSVRTAAQTIRTCMHVPTSAAPRISSLRAGVRPLFACMPCRICMRICDGVSPLIPHLNGRRVRKGKEGTRAENSLLNRTVPVRDAGIEPTTSGPAGSDAYH